MIKLGVLKLRVGY